MKTALLDGDSFLYRAGFAVEKTKYLVELDNDSFVFTENMAESKKLGGTIWTRKELGSVEDAKSILDGMIRRAIEHTDSTDYNVYITPATGNFRDGLCTLKKYKGERPPRPIFYSDLREHMETTHGAIVTTGEEADDRISWVARGYFRGQQRPYVIVGVDKDLMQIPGDHYNWVEDENKNLSDDESRLWYWAQVLAGDPGDNVGGCWGLGLAKASKFLVQCNGLSDDEMWPKVVNKYEESQKLSDCPYKDRKAEEVALETVRLIRLRQVMDESLWIPPEQKQEQGKSIVGKKKKHTSAESVGGRGSRPVDGRGKDQTTLAQLAED